uniref:BTB domain-containing protein n=1 Tax=Clastoptera arizonana TaxID=38151 RepID=A0A1B6C9Z2_9HEMI
MSRYDGKEIKIPSVELLSKPSGLNKIIIPHREQNFSTTDSASLFGADSIDINKNKKDLNTRVPELSLKKMGFGQDSTIDWSTLELPVKTDLHKLIHYRITNYLNPDIIIKIGNNEFKCHLLVLQCYSGLFNEQPVSRMEIPENKISKNAFMNIYAWMLNEDSDCYNLLNRDNILEIFMAARYLKVKELEEQCWAFIDNEDLFSEDKAFMLYLDARKHSNVTIMELMVPRIQKFFLVLVSSKDFLELAVEEICLFLSSNYICINGEIEVFMCGVRWLMHDWDTRSQYLVSVMRCIRFGLIAPWQLVDITRNPKSEEFLIITKDPKVSKMIEDGLAFAIIKYRGGQGCGDYNNCTDAFGLPEPPGRNWTGTEKNYYCYQDFLDDLESLKEMHKLERKQLKCPNAGKS